MINTKALVPELQKQVEFLTADLLTQSNEVPEIGAFLRGEFAVERQAGRSARGFEEWRDDMLEQVAVAWVLSCVFVRFIEDNHLINECYLAGDGDRGKHAEGSYELYFRHNPLHEDQDYLKFVFTEIGKLPSTQELFQKGKTALWAVDPSGDGARNLLKFFKQIDPEAGGLRWTFHTFGPDTAQSLGANTGQLVVVYQGVATQAQFLGDLYQDLSVHARKKYALLQTPEFVQKFILDRTLTAAIDQFGLKNLRLIDPACGSGHFLLGAFERLFHEWMKPEHGINNEVIAAQNALDSVFGVDINPFAVAITRFRLIVAAVVACRINKLNQQSYAWRFNLAIGDSLLWGAKPSFGAERTPITRQGQLFEDDSPLAVENPDELRRILGQGYHVVVGNPPYPTVKDKTQNEAYRKVYSTCHRKYSLGVPFTQRFWDLAIQKGERITIAGEEVSGGPGYIGLITANSFMKREFGKKLIEEFFPKTDLTHVIDTSVAYIPGHGTPTVILFGRSRKPVQATVRAVQGIKGEPSTPDDPAEGLVWQSILRHIDIANAEDEFTSSADVTRETFAAHPWSIGGGGIADLKEQIEDMCDLVLGTLIETIGFGAILGEDDVFGVPVECEERVNIDKSFIRPLIQGDHLRDWNLYWSMLAIFPYDNAILLSSDQSVIDSLWSYRTVLENRLDFSKRTYAQAGRPHWEYHQIPIDRQRTLLSIAFAEVATHNHFVLDRGGKVFNRTAPIIKLPADATEDDHLALLGLLNSSTACFWLKQSCHNKGSTVDQHGARQRTDAFEDFYQFNSTRVQQLPVPDSKPLSLSRRLDEIAQQLGELAAERILKRWAKGEDLQALLAAAEAEAGRCRGRMIALQEELDWECYRHYGLLADDLCSPGGDVPEVRLGERAFEIVLARQVAAGKLQTAWFARHGSTPITELPAHWPADYRAMVERRLRTIEANKEIALIERPEYKRRWNTEPWADRQERAVKLWLLDRLETPKYRKGTPDRPELTTTARMADVASADAEFLAAAAVYRGRPDFDVAALVAELVTAEAVPLLPVLRYKPSGLRKRAVWERTWELQRKQDAGEDVGTIDVPPKYATADFLKTDYWRLRGKLDVPKERWVSYPHCHTDGDTSLVVGWAGYNHLEQATALVGYYDARKREGWDAKRLEPLLAGLDQLLPWVSQWHPEVDAEFGESAGESFRAMLGGDAHELGLTLDTVRTWTPPQTSRKGRTPTKSKPAAGDRDDA